MKSLNIQQKLYLPMIIVLISCMFIAYSYQQSNQTLLHLEKQKLQYAHIHTELQHILAQISQAEVHAAMFPQTHQGREYKNFNHLIEDSKDSIQQLLAIMQAENLNSHELKRSLQRLDRYQESFKQLVYLEKEIGLNEDLGLRGSMREAAHQIEQQTLAEKQQALTISLLQLRRHEKDYFARHQQKYHLQFRQEFNQFTQLLQHSSLNKQTKQGLKQTALLYQQSFENLASQSKKRADDIIQLSQQANQLSQTLLELSQSISTKVQKKDQEADQLIQSISKRFFVMLFIVLILALCSVAYIAQSIIVPIKALLRHIQAISRGDGNLRERLNSDGNDELAQLSHAINTMMDKLSSMIVNIQHHNASIASTSKQIESAMQKHVATLKQQTSSTQQMAVSAQEIADTSAHLQQKMNTVVQHTTETCGSAKQGQSDLKTLEQSLKKMQGASDDIATKLAQLNDKAHNISQVTSTILKVADQTNMLSLNASIEAEKAGEYGRGFSVVAQEIRHLADQTAEASIDIETLIQGIQTSIAESVISVDKFTYEINHGVQTGDIVKEHLGAVIEQTCELEPMISSAHKTLTLQAKDAKRISIITHDFNDMTAQASHVIKQTSNATEEMNQAVQKVQHMLGDFKVQHKA